MIVIAIILIFPLLFTSSSCLSPPVQEPTGNIADTYPKSLLNDILPSFSDYYENECSSVIVTGTASKDGRAILMKNRDWANDEKNRLVYIPATSSTFAYIGVNINAMGINERGLAVMNTAMPALESEPGIGNLFLNQKILELYESVTDVAIALNDSGSPIGPKYRSATGAIATCLGIIDRFGAGAFFEVSSTEAYVQYVINGYDTRANHPRIFPGLASGPNGRDQYLLDSLDEIFAQNGVVSWKDVMQKCSRYVHNRELGTISFPIDGEVCNTATVSAMVAVSGDARYDGKLNIMWGAYGTVPLVSVFVPSMVLAGSPPNSISQLWSYTSEKYDSAQVKSDAIYLDPHRVREIQDFSFFAEQYTIDEYDRLMSSVPSGLTDSQLQVILKEFIDSCDDYASEVFVTESKDVTIPDFVDFPTPTTTITTTTTEVTSLTTTSSQTTSTFPPDIGNTTTSYNITVSTMIGLSVLGGVGIIVLFVTMRHKKS